MHSFTLQSRAPRGERSNPIAIRDRDVIAGHLEDAAHFPGGHATALFSPTSEAEIAAILRTSARVLPIGAQSSLTGGATPMGDALVSTRRLNAVSHLGVDRVRVQAGRDAHRAGRRARASGTVLSAGADLSRRVCGRDPLDQRRRRGHVQIRHDPEVGGFAHGCPRQRRRVGHRSRRHTRAS